MACHPIQHVKRNGQVTIPLEIRQALDIKDGDTLVMVRHGKDIVIKLCKEADALWSKLLKEPNQ